MVCALSWQRGLGSAPYVRIRDPFNLPVHKQKVVKHEIVLDGIVYSGKKRCAAVLACGNKRDVVGKGERFEGYTLSSIGTKFVVLTRGKARKRLVIE